MVIVPLYQAFVLDTESVDNQGRSGGLRDDAKNFTEMEQFKSRLKTKGYEILTSLETYHSFPMMMMLKINGNTRLGSPKQNQIKKDFRLENQLGFPYHPRYFFMGEDIKPKSR